MFLNIKCWLILRICTAIWWSVYVLKSLSVKTRIMSCYCYPLFVFGQLWNLITLILIKILAENVILIRLYSILSWCHFVSFTGSYMVLIIGITRFICKYTSWVLLLSSVPAFQSPSKWVAPWWMRLILLMFITLSVDVIVCYNIHFIWPLSKAFCSFIIGLLF